MQENMQNPTLYPGVNEFIERLLTVVKRILGKQFVGMYLYGSLALGDFDLLKSDIDFLVATTGDLSGQTVASLAEMHARIAAGESRWATELEGSYIPIKALRRYDPADTHHSHIDRGDSLRVEQHDTDWVIQRYVLREFGVTVVGPDPHTLIDPIEPDDLRRAILDLMWWWELQIKDTSRVQKSGYQAYAVLSMCRILYTLKEEKILTKPAAARWAQQNLDPRWTGLIERALTWQPGEEMDRLPDTLDFIGYTLNASRA